jgi:hypothetical protein
MCQKSRFVIALFDSLPETYLRVFFVKGQQLESSFGSETVRAFKNHNDPSVCGCNDAGDKKGFRPAVHINE